MIREIVIVANIDFFDFFELLDFQRISISINDNDVFSDR